MIHVVVVEDAVEVFDADIFVVFETCFCDFDFIISIVDDANNFFDDSIDVCLILADFRDFDFVDFVDAIVDIGDFLVVNFDVVGLSFNTCLKKKLNN